MPDEQAEQTAAVTDGAEEAALGAPEGVAETAVEPVAVDGGAVADEPVIDLSTDDGIRAAIERNPNLKGFLEKTKTDAAHAERQRLESEQRRDRGSNERAQQAIAYIAAQLEAGKSAEDLAKEIAPWVKANEESARIELLTAMLQQAAANGDETAGELAANLRGTAEEMAPVAQRAVDAALKKAEERGFERGYKNSNDEYTARLESERKARALEESTAGRENPPAVSGQTPGGSQQPATAALQAMGDNQFALLMRSDPDKARQLIRESREEAARALAATR